MSKTNLDILDKDSWNYVKNMKNKYEFRSVADYIFKIINLAKSMKLDKWQFLIAIEKFYEYNFYDIDEFSFELGIKPHNVRKMIRKYFGDDTPLYDVNKTQREKITRKIHELMINSRILPRELSIAYNLKEFIDKNRINISNYQEITREFELKNIKLDNRKILSVLFPDDQERKNEVYSITIDTAESIIRSDKLEDFNCDTCEDDCFVKDPEYIYYKSGITVKNEDLEEDLISDILKTKFKENFRVWYGLCLVIAINKLIQSNLLMVKDFIEKELYFFKEPAMFLIFIDVLINYSGTEFISNEKEKGNIEKYIKSIMELSISS